MGQLIVCLICIIVIIIGVMTMMQSSITSVDMLSASWKDMGSRTGDNSRADISDMAENTIADAGASLTITIKNTGEVSVLDYAEWDMVIRYYSSGSNYQVKYL